MEHEFAAILEHFEGEADICGGQESCGLFRPLHQTNVASVELITKSGILPFFGIAKAIQVEVTQV